MDCKTAIELIPGYHDGELSDVQAGPLREHLMGCPACRAIAQDLRAVQGWFVDPPEVEVPADFASRVARRAFAGDRGQEPVPVAASTSEAGSSTGTLHQFVLFATAAAAGLLFVLSLGLGREGQLSGSSLQADSMKSTEEIRRELRALREAGEAEDEAGDEESQDD